MERGSNNRTPLIIYIEVNAFIYLILGLLLLFFSESLVDIELMADLSKRDIGFLQLIGIVAFFFGYYYYFAARTHSISWCLSSIFSRLILVPILFFILYTFQMLDLKFYLPILIFDVLIALGALYFWLNGVNGNNS